MASDKKPIPKNQIRSRNTIEQHEHEDDASARRVVFVGSDGNFIGQDAANPLNVRLSDGSINIGTVEANIEVHTTHLDNSPEPGRVHDSIRIGDGVNENEFDTTMKENRLKVHSTDFLTEVSKGNIPDHREFSNASFALEVSSSGKTIWDGPGFYTFPTSAEVLEIFSSSTDDTSAAIGARSLLIRGLDSNFEEIEETVSLNGTTIVTTSNSFLRINDAIVVSAGSEETNVGEITIRNLNSQNILSLIVARKSISSQAVISVPANKTALLYGGFVLNSKDGLVATINTRNNTTGVTSEAFKIEVGKDRVNIDLTRPTSFPEKSDIWINTATKSGVTSVTGFLNLMLAEL